jgi:hypothetical protein
MMKRRDFLKVTAGTVIAGTIVANEAAGKATTAEVTTAPITPPVGETPATEPPVPEESASVSDQDWSVKFQTVTAHITRDTYNAFFKDRRRSHKSEDFLDYLLSGTAVPHCKKIDKVKYKGYWAIKVVTFTGVAFASNTQQHPLNFFTGYEHARFCLSSPDSKSGTYLTFSERAVR